MGARGRIGWLKVTSKWAECLRLQNVRRQGIPYFCCRDTNSMHCLFVLNWGFSWSAREFSCLVQTYPGLLRKFEYRIWTQYWRQITSVIQVRATFRYFNPHSRLRLLEIQTFGQFCNKNTSYRLCQCQCNCVCWTVPMWAAIGISLMTLLLIVCCCGCLCKICWKKRKDKGFRKGLKSAVDLRSVQILGSTLKEKVWAYSTYSIFIDECVRDFFVVKTVLSPLKSVKI